MILLQKAMMSKLKSDHESWSVKHARGNENTDVLCSLAPPMSWLGSWSEAFWTSWAGFINSCAATVSEARKP